MSIKAPGPRLRDREAVEALVGSVTLEAFLRGNPCRDLPVRLTGEALTRLVHRVEELSRFGVARRRRAIRFAVDITPELRLEAHRPSVFRLLMILIENAFDAVEAAGGGAVAIVAAQVGDDVVLTLSDTGTGLPDALREALSCRARLPEGGGLAEATRLVAQMGGMLRVVHSNTGGTTFELDLPAMPPA